jgi:hypothetical protein
VAPMSHIHEARAPLFEITTERAESAGTLNR